MATLLFPGIVQPLGVVRDFQFLNRLALAAAIAAALPPDVLRSAGLSRAQVAARVLRLLDVMELTGRRTLREAFLRLVPADVRGALEELDSICRKFVGEGVPAISEALAGVLVASR